MGEMQDRESFSILGVNIDPLRKEELLDYIVGSCLGDRKQILSGANAFAMNLAFELPWFRTFMNDSGLVYCDGIGVKWAAGMAGKHIPVRLTHLDWIFDLFRLCEKHQLSLYMLGGKGEVSDLVRERLLADFPALPAVYSHHGYFNKEYNNEENVSVVEEINNIQPDILFVCFGMPLQEKWLRENWERLQVKVAIPGGATIDYISGEVERVDDFFVEHQLEWLGRLIREPRRLWKRYLVGNPLFLMRILWYEVLSLGKLGR